MIPTMQHQGRYICFSGGEGSGKTTVIERLKTTFPDFVFVREPGGTDFGMMMRQQLLARQYSSDPWTEVFLLMADRMEVLNRIVRPALRQGKTVLSDRCWIETLVYQILTKIGEAAVPTFLNLIATTSCPQPDLWLWLDIEPATGLARRHATGEVNSFDTDALELHTKYRESFGKVSGILPTMPFVRIDASKSRDDVYTAVQSAMMTNQDR